LLNHFGSIVINGGAAVAILAYLGSLARWSGLEHRFEPSRSSNPAINAASAAPLI
jgi:hypothetical protein